jgi:hypothetical protein
MIEMRQGRGGQVLHGVLSVDSTNSQYGALVMQDVTG